MHELTRSTSSSNVVSNGSCSEETGGTKVTKGEIRALLRFNLFLKVTPWNWAAPSIDIPTMSTTPAKTVSVFLGSPMELNEHGLSNLEALKVTVAPKFTPSKFAAPLKRTASNRASLLNTVRAKITSASKLAVENVALVAKAALLKEQNFAKCVRIKVVWLLEKWPRSANRRPRIWASSKRVL